MIGSTANIVALGMLEKRYRTHVYFFEWLKIGAIVGIVSCVIAWAGITVLSPYMPTTQQRLDEAALRMKTYPAAHNIVEPNKP
jgi:di/tricarboxylate transporter